MVAIFSSRIFTEYEAACGCLRKRLGERGKRETAAAEKRIERERDRERERG